MKDFHEDFRPRLRISQQQGYSCEVRLLRIYRTKRMTLSYHQNDLLYICVAFEHIIHAPISYSVSIEGEDSIVVYREKRKSQQLAKTLVGRSVFSNQKLVSLEKSTALDEVVLSLTKSSHPLRLFPLIGHLWKQ